MNAELIRMLEDEDCSCAASDGINLYRGTGMGVKPIIGPMRENRNFFAGREVADTVIGKAAALLLILSGAAAVYGRIISRPGAELLAAHGIPYEYGEMVEYIRNRTGDGMCPLEASVQEENDPEQAWDKIEACIAELMKNK